MLVKIEKTIKNTVNFFEVFVNEKRIFFNKELKLSRIISGNCIWENISFFLSKEGQWKISYFFDYTKIGLMQKIELKGIDIPKDSEIKTIADVEQALKYVQKQIEEKLEEIEKENRSEIIEFQLEEIK